MKVLIDTNKDDYARKFEDYEAMGIPEYWIVDYRGLGGRRYIGSPKQPTIMVCQLVEGDMRRSSFIRENRWCRRVFQI